MLPATGRRGEIPPPPGGEPLDGRLLAVADVGLVAPGEARHRPVETVAVRLGDGLGADVEVVAVDLPVTIGDGPLAVPVGAGVRLAVVPVGVALVGPDVSARL